MFVEMKFCKFRWTPELRSLEERAKGIVITTINHAKDRLGIRQNLYELARTAEFAWFRRRLPLSSIETPIPVTAEKFLIDSIENYWHLNDVFKYCLKYIGMSSDDISAYYYFEIIFSQPTADTPIPQATASIFFRVEQQITERGKAPLVYFRIEGHHTDHDVRVVAPVADNLLALIQYKIKFFRRLEALNLF